MKQRNPILIKFMADAPLDHPLLFGLSASDAILVDRNSTIGSILYSIVPF